MTRMGIELYNGGRGEDKDMKLTAKQFKEELVEEIRNAPKTSYGKNELILRINEIYADFLERYIE